MPEKRYGGLSSWGGAEGIETPRSDGNTRIERTVPTALDRDAYESARVEWFEAIANLINEESRISVTEPWADPIPSSLIRLHVFAGHFSGFRDEDLLMSAVNAAAVTREISRWRDGRVPPRLARYWEAAWHSFYLYIRDNRLVDHDHLRELLETPTGRHMARRTRRELDPAKSSPDVFDRLNEIVADRQPVIIPPEHVGVLHLGSPHLDLAFNLIIENEAVALALLTPLEFLSALPDTDQDRILDRWLVSSSNHHRLYLTAPGEWSGSAQDGIADHVGDWVLRWDGRQGHATTGVVPGWFATTESEADLREFRRIGHGIGFASSHTSDLFEIHLHPITESGDASRLHATYSYPRSVVQLQDLATLTAIGSVLFDLLHLDGNNNLRHEATFNIPIPDEIIQQAISWIGVDFEGWTFEAHLETIPTREVSAALRAEAAERRRFELAHLARARIDGRLDDRLATALGECLRALRRASALGDVGSPTPANAEYARTRSELRSLVNDLRPLGQDISPNALAALGTNRAFLHFESQSGVPFIVASWLDQDGDLRNDWFEFSNFPWPHAATAATSASLLAEGLAELIALQGHGIQHLVVSPPTWGYALPFHQALLVNGFATASYAPTLDLLQPPAGEARRRKGRRRDAILSWPGTGSRYLRGVEAETELVREVLPDAELQAPIGSGTPLRYVHVAGHGQSGATVALTGIDVGPGLTLRGVDVLADQDLSGTDLVVLCACSTGSVRYSSMQLHENAPLDVCILACGARSVVSTAWPVDDLAAFLFTAALYSSLQEGKALWDAFATGVSAARDRSRESLSPDACRLADKHWPTWDNQPLIEESHEDWLAFRLSGRHWE